MVTYLLIIMGTILVLTYIAYRFFPLMSYGLSPKMLASCGITAFVFGMLATQIVVYIHNLGMVLGVLLVMLVISSSVLVLTNSVSVEGAADPQIITSRPNDFSNFVTDVEVIHTEELATTLTERIDPVSEAAMNEIVHIDEVLETDMDATLDINVVSVLETNIDAELEESMNAELEKISNTLIEENMEVEPDKSADIHADFDWYLDAGFQAKVNCNYKAAIVAFEKAIDLEPDNPTTLLVITEICASLKLLGYYDDAIRQMERGRNLALGFEEQGMVDQFVEGIAYLRILKNALMTEGFFYMPYQALSEELKGKVEEDFRQWKLNT